MEARQSGVFKGVDYSDRDTDTVTCHSGTSIDLVRKIALALFDEGIPLRAISEPDAENTRFKQRITLEAAAKNRPLLTRDAIYQLQACPTQIDPVYGKGR